MSYLLFIQVHKKVSEKVITQFKEIAYINGLSFRSENYIGYYRKDSYVNLYLKGNNLIQIKKAWAFIIKSIALGEKIPSNIKNYLLARVIKNKRGDLCDFSIRLADYTNTPDSRDLAHDFLRSSFSCKKYLSQLPELDEFGRYELMIQIRSNVLKPLIKELKLITSKHELPLKVMPYNEKENYTNFFIEASKLQDIKDVWRNLLEKSSNELSPIFRVKHNWAVVLYADYRTDEYVVLADSELPLGSKAIADDFLNDNFSWCNYQNQFPEELIFRKYDLKIKMPRKNMRNILFELKKIVHQRKLIWGIGKEDECIDEIDFYIIGYSFEEMKSIWLDILSKVNDSKSIFSILKNEWSVTMWRSNLIDTAILLASTNRYDKKVIDLRLIDTDPFSKI